MEAGGGGLCGVRASGDKEEEEEQEEVRPLSVTQSWGNGIRQSPTLNRSLSWD